MKFSLRHQSTGIIYRYIVPAGNLMLRGFMRKMYVHNRHGVPANTPVLLASNHPTAFVDPCVLCVFLDPPLYNMTRGDIFKKPFFRRLLESINMFPVFRMRDGYGSRDRNEEVFEFCRQRLAHRGVVTIYVEGEHHLERRVRPIQKGIIRIAFGTLEQHHLDDLQIVPVSCNYVYGDRPRDEVMMNVGAPIFLRDYWVDYQRDPNGATARLVADIESKLKTICLHIDNPADDDLAEQLLTLVRGNMAGSLVPIVEYQNKRFEAEKSLCDRLNALPGDEKAALREAAKTYFNALAARGLHDDALVHPEWGAWGRLLFFALGLAPMVLGRLGSLPVVALARYVTKKVVKKREFLSSVHMGVGFLWGMLYYLLWFLASLPTGNPWWIALSMVLPVLGWFDMFYRENWVRWRRARRALRHSDRNMLLGLRQVLQQHKAFVKRT